ncbi:hypothetical protein JMG10_19895 [Nostoc ellipsosporum NOK]|nr:hypothetical protein [Nostoc ellipsosporum NOK]
MEELNKLPKPTSQGLAKLFVGVDKVVIKDSGVYETKAISEKIVLTISQADKIQKLNKLLQIDENNTGFYCMCLGTYAIELYSNTEIKATIGFHHGDSIRYHYWHGDAALAKSNELLNFLAEQGLREPLANREEQERSMEEDRTVERKWLDIAPRCFQKYWKQICSRDYNYFVPLVRDLNLEIPDREDQIITLLQTFGKTENFWTAYPSYEELPNDILKLYAIEEIIKAYVNSDRNYKIRRGLGRYLCSFEFKKIRKKQLKYITTEVIDDLEKCFESIGEKRGIKEILSLRNDKNNN